MSICVVELKPQRNNKEQICQIQFGPNSSKFAVVKICSSTVYLPYSLNKSKHKTVQQTSLTVSSSI